MIKEYCDRCKSEISNEDKEKKILQITYPTGHYSYAGYENVDSAKITLCRKCFSEMGISETVKSVGVATRKEKDPDAVEKLMDIFRELITECMENEEH